MHSSYSNNIKLIDVPVELKSVLPFHRPLLQEAEGARRGGEGKEEGREDKKTGTEVAGKRGEEEPQESEATTGRGTKETADEDRHGREKAAAGSAQPGVFTTCC